MIDIEKFICSLLADHPEGVAVRGDIHRALKEQGLEYKDGKIVPIEDKTEPKESEDERISEDIITYLSTVEDKELIPYESWLAWLKKQGEQKQADKVEPKFHEGDIITSKDGSYEPLRVMQVDIPNKKYRLDGGYVIHFSQEDAFELAEQKPIERKDFISIPFGTDSEFIKEAIAIPDGCVATIEGNRIHIQKK